MANKLIPLGDRIVIRQLAAEKEISHGTLKLVTADTHQEKPQQGEIQAIGEKQAILKVGDRVLYAKYAGSAFNMDGVELLVLDESDVMCKVM